MPKLEWISRATARERSKRTRPQIESANRFNGAHFVAPHLNARANLIANSACTGEAFIVRAAERRWVRKTPVQSLCIAGKDRAAFGAALIANGDHVGKSRSRGTGFENVGHGLSLLLQNIMFNWQQGTAIS